MEYTDTLSVVTRDIATTPIAETLGDPFRNASSHVILIAEIWRRSVIAVVEPNPSRFIGKFPIATVSCSIRLRDILIMRDAEQCVFIHFSPNKRHNYEEIVFCLVFSESELDIRINILLKP
uniref:Uncharacterized protein n=1 Tax=Entomoneis paludosa TaxID=265537 RepID=A0A7S3DPT9_9STRA